jgi:hypothetical protein
MTIENVCRINVWPTMAEARAAFDGADGSELCGRMIVWPTTKLAKEYMEEEGGGDAGTPAWVPANAKIHIDFLGGTPQGRAWVDGTGEVAIETLLGSDPNAESGIGEPTGYDSADLAAGGYMPDTATAFLGAAKIKLLEGATFRWVQQQIVVDGTGTMLCMSSLDGAAGIQIDVKAFESSFDNSITFSSWSGSIHSTLKEQLNFAVGTTNGIACTVTATRLEATANGYPTPIDDTLLDADRPAANPLVAASFIYKSGTSAIQVITIYDPLPTTAGLPALSEVP